MTITLLPRAEADLVRQFRYYLLDRESPRTALRFREAVIKGLNQLKQHPRMGSLLHGPSLKFRSWPVKGFEAVRIYYLESPATIRIIRILHGSRDVRQILDHEV